MAQILSSLFDIKCVIWYFAEIHNMKAIGHVFSGVNFLPVGFRIGIQITARIHSFLKKTTLKTYQRVEFSWLWKISRIKSKDKKIEAPAVSETVGEDFWTKIFVQSIALKFYMSLAFFPFIVPSSLLLHFVRARNIWIDLKIREDLGSDFALLVVFVHCFPFTSKQPEATPIHFWHSFIFSQKYVNSLHKIMANYSFACNITCN